MSNGSKAGSIAAAVIGLLTTVLLAIVQVVVWIGSPWARADDAAPAAQPGLEFHILADQMTSTPGQLAAMDGRLADGGAGPARQAGDSIGWFDVDHPEQYDRPGEPPLARQWGGKHYLPLLITADASMSSADVNWRLADVREQVQYDGAHGIVFSFDNAGAKLFGELTTHWFELAQKHNEIPDAHARLAIVVEGRIISMPQLNTPITRGSGIIRGGSNGGFTAEEVGQLIDEMRDNGATSQASAPATTQP